MMKTFIDHKFEVGQKVFFLDREDKCKPFLIDTIRAQISNDGVRVFYYEKDSYFPRMESELFATEADVKNHIFGDLIDFV